MESISKELMDVMVQPTPIRVVLRLKPTVDEAAKLSYIEDGTGSISLQDFPEVEDRATFLTGTNDTNKFRFNKIYDVDTRTQDVYEDIMGNSLMELLTGFNVSVMLFGSEGSGKIYTMFGDDHEKGIVPLICQQLFKQLNDLHHDTGTEATIALSYYELFAENVHDLLSLEKNPKGLKTSNNSRTNDISIKGLRTVTVNSADELLSYVNESHTRRCNNGSYFRRSKSSGFLNITVTQRNAKEETMKTSILQLIDLASTDKLDKSSKQDISTEELKSINSSIQDLHQVIHGLSESELSASTKNQNSKQPHRASRLTKFLQQAIGGDSKTTAILLCSTEKMDKENTVTTLSFGSKLKSIYNIPLQHKMGLNQKALLDLSLKNMDIRENSYLTRIEYLENEVNRLGINLEQNKADASTNKTLTEENAKLKDQLELLRKSTEARKSESKTLESQSHSNGKAENDASEILENLMEKCEQVIQLQLRLDEEIRQKSQMSQQINYKESKAQALEAINLKLLEQLDSNEKELKNVFDKNTVFQKGEEKWMLLAESRSERIGELEKEIQEHQLGNFPQNGGLFVPGELNHSRDESKYKKGNWFFGNSQNNIWGTRKISNVSTSSAVTTNSQESSSSRASHKGFNLHAVRPPE